MYVLFQPALRVSHLTPDQPQPPAHLPGQPFRVSWGAGGATLLPFETYRPHFLLAAEAVARSPDSTAHTPFLWRIHHASHSGTSSPPNTMIRRASEHLIKFRCGSDKRLWNLFGRMVKKNKNQIRFLIRTILGGSVFKRAFTTQSGSHQNSRRLTSGIPLSAAEQASRILKGVGCPCHAASLEGPVARASPERESLGLLRFALFAQTQTSSSSPDKGSTVRPVEFVSSHRLPPPHPQEVQLASCNTVFASWIPPQKLD